MNLQYNIAMKIQSMLGGKYSTLKYGATESELREVWPFLNEKDKLRALEYQRFSLDFIREIHDNFIKENWCYLLYRNDCYKDDVLYKIPFIKEYKLQSKENYFTDFVDWIERD